MAGARKYFDFQVKATPSAGPTKSVSAQLIHKPVFSVLASGPPLILLPDYFRYLGAATLWFESNKDKLNNTSACGHVSLFCSNNGGKPTPTPIGQIAKGKPKFIGAFANFHKVAPLLVGKALENESTTGRAATQFTSTGLLLFDRHDGVTYLIRQSDSTVWEFYKGKTLQVR